MSQGGRNIQNASGRVFSASQIAPTSSAITTRASRGVLKPSKVQKELKSQERFEQKRRQKGTRRKKAQGWLLTHCIAWRWVWLLQQILHFKKRCAGQCQHYVEMLSIDFYTNFPLDYRLPSACAKINCASLLFIRQKQVTWLCSQKKSCNREGGCSNWHERYSILQKFRGSWQELVRWIFVFDKCWFISNSWWDQIN